MREHNNLVPQSLLRAHMERSGVPTDDDDDNRIERTNTVSLFGRPRNLSAVISSPPVRLRRDIFNAPADLPFANPARVWESLNSIQPAVDLLEGNGLFPSSTLAPVVAVFDILRTSVLQALSERGWNRVGITSPSYGCGKSFVAANLALSLARRPSSRTVLMDLDLRKPSIGDLFGQTDLPPLAEFLSGDQPLESHFLRYGKTLALGVNGRAERDPGAILHNPVTGATLDVVLTQLAPEVMLLDLPPALGRDDVLALQPQIDTVLLITDGTRTSPDEIIACERLFEGRIPILGVVLNRGEDQMPGLGK